MLKYYFKESFQSILRAKSFFVLSLFSMTISLLLIFISIITLSSSAAFQKKMKNEFSVNLFLNDDLTPNKLEEIKTILENRSYIKEIKYISKEEAADLFIRETGEDFKKILDYNPLPGSFVLKFNENYVEPDSIKKIIPSLSKLEGVDEVVFKQEYLTKLVEYLNSLKKYLLIATVILLFIALYINYSTVKMVINSRVDELETMKLVGAKISSIKIPIILNSCYIGLASSLITLSIFNLYISYFDKYINILKYLEKANLFNSLMILAIGPALGLLVSVFSLRKITLKI